MEENPQTTDSRREQLTQEDYPLTALPEFAQPIVQELAKGYGCSVSLPATIALGFMSGTAGKMATLTGLFPRLWALVNAPDCEEFMRCMTILEGPFQEVTGQVFEAEDCVAVDDWENYSTLINHSPDGSVLISIRYSGHMCLEGARDDSMPCVGRMATEAWLQPSVWKEVFAADCHVGRAPSVFGVPISQQARQAWEFGLLTVTKQRAELANSAYRYPYTEALDAALGASEPTENLMRLALLISIFKQPFGVKPGIETDDMFRAQALLAWHNAGRKRIWDAAQSKPWGTPVFSGGWSSLDSVEVSEFVQRSQAIRSRKVARIGVPARKADDGVYVLAPDAKGTPCGAAKLLQMGGTETHTRWCAPSRDRPGKLGH